jgi:dCTP deaminase
MHLSDIDIKKAVECGDIVIKNFEPERIQPASYDILLGNKFILTEPEGTDFIDPVKDIKARTREVTIKEGERFVLHPGVSVLGTSYDYFGSKKYLIQLSGKSSLARIGLIIHNTAGIINPGHFLNVTLELYNLNTVPIILRPKMEIAQITFSQLSTPPKKDYAEVGRYHEKDWNSYIPKKG